MRLPPSRANRLIGLVLAAVALTMSAGCPNVVSTTPDEPAPTTDAPAGVALPEPIIIDVMIEGPGVVDQTAMGNMVTLTARPDLGWQFERWSGSLQSKQNPITVLARESTRITAHFGEYVPDEDEDGVRDEFDDCPFTPHYEQADERTGCSCSQLDDDGDGLVNCDDLCPGTVAGRSIDEGGCSCYQIDDDGDGVPNCGDYCPGTASDDGPVNDNGCGKSQRDTDYDGVKDNVDICEDTPIGSHVNDKGCPPVCGNDEVEYGEDCDPPDGVDCDDECVTIPAVCGNGLVQHGEDCEPPNTSVCDANCRVIPVCGNGVVEGDEECDPPNYLTCDASCELIVGGGCGTGSCYVNNGTPGCDDQDCCDAVCCFDSYCCTTNWDADCAFYASSVCLSGYCNNGSGSCRSPHGSPGCGDSTCCNVICAFDSYCCSIEWDEGCASFAQFLASDSGGCICGGGSG